MLVPYCCGSPIPVIEHQEKTTIHDFCECGNKKDGVKFIILTMFVCPYCGEQFEIEEETTYTEDVNNE